MLNTLFLGDVSLTKTLTAESSIRIPNIYHGDNFRVVFQQPRPWLVVGLTHVSGDSVVAVTFLAERAEQPRVAVDRRPLTLGRMSVVAET